MNDRSASAEAWRRALEMTAPIVQHPSVTFPIVIDRLADQFGDTRALISDQQSFSYRTLADRTARYAHWGLEQNLAPGDVVCLMMPNCPEYLAIWVGITRIGGVVALLNTNLVGDALRHAIDIVAPRHVIVDASLGNAFAAVQPRLAGSVRAWFHGGDGHGLPRIDRAVESLGAALLDHPPPTLRDRALYIYTSGTTGLPKAASVSHYRIMQWSHWFAGLINAAPSDRMYNCLPMYHSVGGVVAVGAPLVAGGSVVIRDRFSASRFWDDITDHGCTLFQYIGELCRYLVGSAPHPRETQHQLRLACGNGLRADVWEKLQDRFRIPRILEFYAATEGSFSLYNCEGKLGAIGRIPPFLSHRQPVVLVKTDLDSGEPVRSAEGFCIRCADDEPGEAIGKLPHTSSLAGQFEGYTDPAASDRKILRDVFASGDAWYRAGDLMRRDHGGFFYFVDRLGDTFRCKGENVSTTEIEEVVAAYPGVVEAVVYGVAVPGVDGRVGMAAIVARPEFELTGFATHLAERLPDYARPLFLRLCSEIVITGTFKPQKQALARAGYDLTAVTDALFVYDRRLDVFKPLDAELYQRIERGELRP